jgi:hypothetical protein
MHSLSGHQTDVACNTPEPYTGIPYKKAFIIMGEKHKSALFWVITRRTVLIPYLRFGATYLSHLQGSNNPINLA